MLEVLTDNQSCNVQDVEDSIKFRRNLPAYGQHRTPPSFANIWLSQHSSECGVLLGLQWTRLHLASVLGLLSICASISSTDFLQSWTHCTPSRFFPHVADCFQLPTFSTYSTLGADDTKVPKQTRSFRLETIERSRLICNYSPTDLPTRLPKSATNQPLDLHTIL